MAAFNAQRGVLLVGVLAATADARGFVRRLHHRQSVWREQTHDDNTGKRHEAASSRRHRKQYGDVSMTRRSGRIVLCGGVSLQFVFICVEKLVREKCMFLLPTG